MFINPSFMADIRGIILSSRENAIRTVDHQRTLMYWHIGRRIFEEEQQGRKRAEYGKYLIRYLSAQLQPEFGSGFSVRQLNWYRQFYRVFPIVSTLWTQLSWSHYKLLLTMDTEDQRAFYMAETLRNNWSVRQLERQVHSNLYERLLAGSDREKVLAVARREQVPEEAAAVIKDPLFLEFLGLKGDKALYEKDLEQAIITHLQEFLLELGNGFAFIARQKRIHINGDDFFIDLVLYNRLLQCFVIVEIKTGKLTHQDLGQLQMYVNYYDRMEKTAQENPTIGILLCAARNDAVVKFSLPEGQKQIFASRYSLYLPTEQQLIAEIQKELKHFRQNNKAD